VQNNQSSPWILFFVYLSIILYGGDGMDLKELYSRVEQIVTTAISSGQDVEQTVEKEVEKVAKDFFAKSGEKLDEIQKVSFDVIKDVKEKAGDNKDALTGVAVGMMKGAQEGAKLSATTAKDIATNLVKECISIGLDLKDIPLKLFKDFKKGIFG
jgi:BMFP domain-containing protein YqiC